MKILIVHNFYKTSAPSGENNIVLEEINALRARGHEVIEYFKYNDDLQSNLFKIIKLPITVIFNLSVYFEFKKILFKEKPDIVHIHNTFPQISPSIIYSAKSIAPVVMTLHNYRVFCASGVACNESINSFISYKCFKNRCYRNSYFHSFIGMLYVDAHKLLGTWTKKNLVNQFICLSEFQKFKMIKFGISAERIAIKGNALFKKPRPVDYLKRTNDCIFVGRLSSEKGIRTLITAWELMGSMAPKLQIFGDGPLREIVKEAAKKNPSIIYEGFVEHNKILKSLENAKLLIQPSEWFEGYPLTMREAIATSTPIIASNIGSMSEIVLDNKTGKLFEPKSFKDLASSVEEFFSDQNLALRMSKEQRILYETKVSPESNLNILENIYKRAL